MKKILLVVLLFTCGLSAQTLTVSGTTYNIVSGDLLTIANSYVRGYEAGLHNAEIPNCLTTTVTIELRDDGSSGVALGTYVDQATPNAAVLNIQWILTRWNNEVIDITDQVAINGDINFGYRAAISPANGAPLDPVDGYVQEGDVITVTYTDACGSYVGSYTVPSSAPAARSGGRRDRPPKIKKPII